MKKERFRDRELDNIPLNITYPEGQHKGINKKQFYQYPKLYHIQISNKKSPYFNEG